MTRRTITQIALSRADRTALDAARRARAVQLRAEGLTTTVIGARLGVSPSRVSRYLIESREEAP